MEDYELNYWIENSG